MTSAFLARPALTEMTRAASPCALCNSVTANVTGIPGGADPQTVAGSCGTCSGPPPMPGRTALSRPRALQAASSKATSAQPNCVLARLATRVAGRRGRRSDDMRGRRCRSAMITIWANGARIRTDPWVATVDLRRKDCRKQCGPKLRMREHGRPHFLPLRPTGRGRLAPDCGLRHWPGPFSSGLTVRGDADQVGRIGLRNRVTPGRMSKNGPPLLQRQRSADQGGAGSPDPDVARTVGVHAHVAAAPQRGALPDPVGGRR